MIGEFNKVFDRDFVVGFFVPALAFVLASLDPLRQLGALPPWLIQDGAQTLKDATTLAVAAWIWAMLLLGINRGVFRFLEGYWPLGLRRGLGGRERARFRKLRRRIEELESGTQRSSPAAAGSPPDDERARLLRYAARRFPGEEELVLPNSFGNIVRAFEDYPRIMYGFESIEGWPRLYAVVPKDYREVMGAARAQVDMWVNLWLSGLLACAEFACAAGRASRPGLLWYVAGSGIFSLWAYRMACGAAARWGDWVKAAFDAFLPELGKKLGYAVPADREQEKAFWLTLSQAMVFRDPVALDDLSQYRQRMDPASAPPATRT